MIFRRRVVRWDHFPVASICFRLLMKSLPKYVNIQTYGGYTASIPEYRPETGRMLAQFGLRAE